MPTFHTTPIIRRARDLMLQELEARGITNARVLSAFEHVPRHLFVQEALQEQAYGMHPLPIGCGQTISQPFVVALMSQLLDIQPGMRVLEVGTGSGYQAAILAFLGATVYTIERIPALHTQSKQLLASLNYHNITCYLADGTIGYSHMAPYDRIIVTAGGPQIPQPLLEQLADPGIMLLPLGDARRHQELVRIRKNAGKLFRQQRGVVSFVDLVGEHGWQEHRKQHNKPKH